jgi:phospholipid/cholesterol/gamma-HCH transport system substrate-binding protein
MEKSANYFIVGLFTTGTILAIFLFLVWLASPKDEKDYDFYTVEFSDSISGLEEGSNVEYKGVKVGKVIKLRLDKENDELVYADIGVGKETPVRAHTKVSLETQGITGLVRIELATRNDDRELPQKKEGEKYPILHGEGSKLYKALEDLPEITEKILSIATKFDGLLDDGTRAALKQTARNIENMSRDMNGLLSPPNVANVSAMISNLSVSSAQVPELVDHLKKTADQMDAAATNLNGIIARNKGHINRFAAEGLPQITAASREAKGTAASLRGLADKLKDDPSQIIYQPSARGVEIPR